jgi:hypothetical protein
VIDSGEAFNTSQLKSRLAAINATWAKTKTTNIDLIKRNLDPTKPYIAEDYSARIYAIYEEMRDGYLGMVTHVRGAAESTFPSSINSVGPLVSITNIAKIPRINIPKFSEKYEDYESVKDQRTTLPDSTKLQYLKSCLVGHSVDLEKNIIY